MCVKRVQRSTIDKKIYLSTHPRKIGYDVSVLRPSVHSLGGEGRESGVCPLGEEYDVFSWPEIVRCICGTLV